MLTLYLISYFLRFTLLIITHGFYRVDCLYNYAEKSILSKQGAKINNDHVCLDFIINPDGMLQN